MIEIDRAMKSRNLNGGIVIQVHDEILIDCPEGESDVIEEIVREKMTGAVEISVPLEVQVGKGKSWYEAH